MESVTHSAGDWLVWQLVDSGFPTGGFAHSGGLEAVWQAGEAGSREDLPQFIESALVQCGKGFVPFLNAAFWNPDDTGEIDWACDRFLTNHVSNRASRLQGQALIASAARSLDASGLRELWERVRGLPGHLAPTFGVTSRVLGLDHLTAVRVFLFMNVRTYISSAVRLGIIGPMEGQAIQARMATRAEAVTAACAALDWDVAVQTAPIVEILHGAQDRLYSRLFQS